MLSQHDLGLLRGLVLGSPIACTRTGAMDAPPVSPFDALPTELLLAVVAVVTRDLRPCPSSASWRVRARVDRAALTDRLRPLAATCHAGLALCREVLAAAAVRDATLAVGLCALPTAAAERAVRAAPVPCSDGSGSAAASLSGFEFQWLPRALADRLVDHAGAAPTHSLELHVAFTATGAAPALPSASLAETAPAAAGTRMVYTRHDGRTKYMVPRPPRSKAAVQPAPPLRLTSPLPVLGPVARGLRCLTLHLPADWPLPGAVPACVRPVIGDDASALEEVHLVLHPDASAAAQGAMLALARAVLGHGSRVRRLALTSTATVPATAAGMARDAEVAGLGFSALASAPGIAALMEVDIMWTVVVTPALVALLAAATRLTRVKIAVAYWSRAGLPELTLPPALADQGKPGGELRDLTLASAHTHLHLFHPPPLATASARVFACLEHIALVFGTPCDTLLRKWPELGAGPLPDTNLVPVDAVGDLVAQPACSPSLNAVSLVWAGPSSSAGGSAVQSRLHGLVAHAAEHPGVTTLALCGWPPADLHLARRLPRRIDTLIVAGPDAPNIALMQVIHMVPGVREVWAVYDPHTRFTVAGNAAAAMSGSATTQAPVLSPAAQASSGGGGGGGGGWDVLDGQRPWYHSVWDEVAAGFRRVVYVIAAASTSSSDISTRTRDRARAALADVMAWAEYPVETWPRPMRTGRRLVGVGDVELVLGPGLPPRNADEDRPVPAVLRSMGIESGGGAGFWSLSLERVATPA
ncbi:hypothetical protein H9P43_000088 [Blastocladiella emersonii ATCC 22665]|nr:hypothetical protein H9P43_000088 [Blastocladiella emersonii ATCC 22665]